MHSSSSSDGTDQTIFVSVASYRDTKCLQTIKSLFDMAAQPDRVFVGTCEQNTVDDTSEGCVTWDDPVLRKFFGNIRRVLLPNTDAEGPCYARYLCSLLYKGEDYFMQIDSHSLLVKNWDQKCIIMMEELPDPAYSILSYYPIPDNDYSPDPKDDIPIPVITSYIINDNGLFQWNPAVYTDMKKTCRKSPYIAAGFLFAPGDFVTRVPFDPKLPYLFMGEEALLTIRAYTSGYDIYTPRLSIVYHTYSRSHQPNVYTDKQSRYGHTDAIRRAQWIMGLTDDDPPFMETDDRYGLGKARSLADYWREINYTPRENFIIMHDRDGLLSSAKNDAPDFVPVILFIGVVLYCLFSYYWNRKLKTKK